MPYVVYRRDGYLIITRRSSPKVLNHILNAYRKMHWFTRRRWLRRYGNVYTVPAIIRPYLYDFVGVHPVENVVSIASSVVEKVLRKVPAGSRILVNTLRKFPYRLGQWLTEPVRPRRLERRPEPVPRVDYFELDYDDIDGVLKMARWVVEVDDYGIARFKRSTWLIEYDDIIRMVVIKDRASLEDILDYFIDDDEDVISIISSIIKRIHKFRRKCPEDCNILNLLNPLAMPGD